MPRPADASRAPAAPAPASARPTHPLSAALPVGALPAGALIAVAALAYANSFSGPFVFDDIPTILGNPTLRSLWPLGPVLSPPSDLGLTATGRPLVNLSLALNYAWSGTAVWSYHVVNLLIHTLAGLALFGLLRRTLARLPTVRGRATLLALSIAALWLAHPLQTAAVTYIVQRAEALVSLFFLLTLYCATRATEHTTSDSAPPVSQSRSGGVPPPGAITPPRPSLPSSNSDLPSPISALRSSLLWQAAALAACALGMATKEVMVSAPLLVWLYDRTFVYGTFLSAWRARRGFYLSLAATWLILAGLMGSSGARGGTAGFGLGIPWWQYAATQCYAIVHYVRLAFWPQPLVIDYGGDVLVSGFAAVWWQALVVAALVGGTIWALIRKPWLGFLGAWCLAILAPTSSFVPLADTLFEHRFYLPLAAVLTLLLLTLHRYLRSTPLYLALSLAATAAAIAATHQRNATYRTELGLWTDTAQKRPANARAHYTVGALLAAEGRDPEALAAYDAALRANPRSAGAHNNLGNLLAKLGRNAEAAAHYTLALQSTPAADTHSNLGNVLLRLQRPAEARTHYEAALQLRADNADAHNNLGNLLAQSGDLPAAAAHYEAALRARPDLPDAHANLGNVLAQSGRPADAIPHYEAALRLRSDFPDACFNLATALLEARRFDEAIARYELTLKLYPTYPNLRPALARAQAMRDVYGK